MRETKFFDPSVATNRVAVSPEQVIPEHEMLVLVSALIIIPPPTFRWTIVPPVAAVSYATETKFLLASVATKYEAVNPLQLMLELVIPATVILALPSRWTIAFAVAAVAYVREVKFFDPSVATNRVAVNPLQLILEHEIAAAVIPENASRCTMVLRVAAVAYGIDENTPNASVATSCDGVSPLQVIETVPRDALVTDPVATTFRQLISSAVIPELESR